MRSSRPQAVVLVGHGSKAARFDRAMKRVARSLASDSRRVICAYLEINEPSIPKAIDHAVRLGARDIRVLPYFLLEGKHVVRDIPEIVGASRAAHGPKVRIRLCPYLGYDPRIVSVARKRLGLR